MLSMLGLGSSSSEEGRGVEQEQLSVPVRCELLVDRLCNSSMLEDRRDAAEELKILAEDNASSGMNFVGRMALRPVVEALCPKPRDEELCLNLLDCLVELVRVPDDVDGEAGGGEDSRSNLGSPRQEPLGLTPQDTAKFNTEFLLAVTAAAGEEDDDDGMGEWGERDMIKGKGREREERVEEKSYRDGGGVHTFLQYFLLP